MPALTRDREGESRPPWRIVCEKSFAPSEEAEQWQQGEKEVRELRDAGMSEHVLVLVRDDKDDPGTGSWGQGGLDP